MQVIEQVETYRRTAVEDWALVLPFANMVKLSQTVQGFCWNLRDSDVKDGSSNKEERRMMIHDTKPELKVERI
jgi:hypothetical protein